MWIGLEMKEERNNFFRKWNKMKNITSQL